MKGSAVINAQIQTAQAPRAVQVRRISPRAFWALLALELALLVGAFVWMLPLALPQRTSQSAISADALRVRDAIADRLSGAVLDPLVELAPGETVRASNLRGLSFGGETYYYYVEGRSNYDPFSAGRVNAAQIQPLLRDDAGPAPIVIYTIHK
jgi:hypothetical protein